MIVFCFIHMQGTGFSYPLYHVPPPLSIRAAKNGAPRRPRPCGSGGGMDEGTVRENERTAPASPGEAGAVPLIPSGPALLYTR